MLCDDGFTTDTHNRFLLGIYEFEHINTISSMPTCHKVKKSIKLAYADSKERKSIAH